VRLFLKSNYLRLSEKTEKLISDKLGIVVKEPLRRDMTRDKATVLRPAYVRDTEKIMHHPFYNRYTDKTQVFSFYKDDDITRRALHVQLVSRIARNIGRLLGLDLDLIEAIALGHDIGHTPFGHAGERFLSEIYNKRTGRFFNHNVHSVRVLDKIFNLNITLDTLSGILCHNGELELHEYMPKALSGFAEFDEAVLGCYNSKENIKKLIPSTLEGCVVRVSDIIAYIGKDRQDAQRAGISPEGDGAYNAYTINNFIVNIVENSFGKDYIKMDDMFFEKLKQEKQENYSRIYMADGVNEQYTKSLEPMFEMLYEKLLSDLQKGSEDTFIYKHHINYINKRRSYYAANDYLSENTPDDIVCDYIASMTDDYFVDLCAYLLPDAPKIKYIGYFE